MKRVGTITIVAAIAVFAGLSCSSNKGAKNAESREPANSVPDTGFTGIKRKTTSDGNYIVSETTYKNGVINGLKTLYYPSGKVMQTSMYVNGMRQDSAKWYYQEGEVFRTTPYKNDTVNGIQKQFYRTGKVKAKILYSKGLRTPFLQEFDHNGKLVTDYPDFTWKTVDNYKTTGQYIINLSVTNKTTKVKFYKGEFTNGLFDTAHVKKIYTADGNGKLVLNKTGKPATDYVGVIAEILTNFGNHRILYKKINLPYKDLQ